MHLVLFCSEEDVNIIKSSLRFLNAVSKVPNERDEDFFVNVIRLVLCGLSRQSFEQDIKSKVIVSLESFLYHISLRINVSKEFNAFNKKLMQSEIKVCILNINL